ncbi:MAG: DUF6263 family protein [Gemmatimonadaceae bacterium]
MWAGTGIKSIALVVTILAAVVFIARPLQAQQKVTLRIRPPVGDTLRMELEQRFEMAREDVAGSPSGSMSGSMRVWTRAVVLRRVGTATDLLSVTDSVRVLPPNAASLPPLRDAKRALEGRTVHLQIAQDGEISVAGGARGAGTSAGVGTDVPAVLPTQPVAVGESWTRNIVVPLSATERETARVHTTLRLDSLSRDGGVAYLSLNGDVTHDHAQHSAVMRGNVTGTLVGTIEIDRRMGWITNSQTVLAIMSVVKSDGRPPVHLRVRVTQSLHALVEG